MTVTVDNAHLKNIANAIRERNGTDETYKPREMAAAIETLPTGSNGEAYIQGMLEGDYFNDRITTLATWGSNTGITSITMPNVTTLGLGTGHTSNKIAQYLDNLKKVDFASLTEINDNLWFYQCHNLTVAILRSNVMCNNLNRAFVHSPISYDWADYSQEQGYIYVPAALKEQYEATYQYRNFRSIEDYPEICG